MKIPPAFFNGNATSKYTRSRHVATILLIATAMVANACGGGNSVTQTPDTTTTTTTTTVIGAPAVEPATVTAAPTSRPTDRSAVEISTRTQFGSEGSFGNFTVDRGNDVLGCSTGSFQDLLLPYGIFRTLTCESGPRSGEFHVFLNEHDDRDGPGDLNAIWYARSGTGDFVGLTGGGEWTGDFVGGGITEAFSGTASWNQVDDETSTGVAIDGEFLAAQVERVSVPESEGAFMIAVLDDEAETVYTSAGTDPAGLEPTPGSGFRVGSVTKVFTAVAIMQLVDDGLVDLDTPAADYVSGVSAVITVRQMLSHTSGLANTHDLADYVSTLVEEPERAWTPGETLDLVAELPAVFEPGTDFRYSNASYLVLGLLIEAVTGQPYHDVVRARIIEPLSLRNTYLSGFEDGAEPFGAYTGVTGARGPVNFDYTSLATSAWSAGAMVSSAQDLHTVFVAMFDGRLVSADSLADMTDGSVYGLGVELFEWSDGLVGHSGQIPGYITFVRHDVASGKTMFTVSTGPDIDQRPALGPLFRALAQSTPANG